MLNHDGAVSTGLKLGLALCVTAGACRSITHEPLLFSVATVAAVARPGDSVSVRISNLSDQTLSYNWCFAQFDRYDGSRWAAMAFGTGAAPCLSNLEVLAPMASRIVTLQLSAVAASGVYRLRLQSVYDASDAMVPEDQRSSNPFRVP